MIKTYEQMVWDLIKEYKEQMWVDTTQAMDGDEVDEMVKELKKIINKNEGNI